MTTKTSKTTNKTHAARDAETIKALTAQLVEAQEHGDSATTRNFEYLKRITALDATLAKRGPAPILGDTIERHHTRELEHRVRRLSRDLEIIRAVLHDTDA